MNIAEFFKSFKECQHKKIGINTKGEYCPDCGKYIVVKWYLVRCSCCGIKRTAYIDFNDNVKPVSRFCPNCGSVETYVEELDKINFVDINFAVHKKEEVEQNLRNSTQLWAETENNQKRILLEMHSQ